MGNRVTTGPASAAETKFRRITVQRFSSAADDAREQAGVRNRLVLKVLSYLAALAVRSSLRANQISEHKARFQNAKGHRVRRKSGTFDFTWEIQRGYGVVEAAHFLPCSLSYGKGDISRLGSTEGEYEALRAPFGEIHNLPAIFNDADQRAEDGGLRRAFESSARKVVDSQRTGGAIDFQAIRDAYVHHWQAGADLAYLKCLQELEPLMEPEKRRRNRLERDRHTGLDESHIGEQSEEELEAQFYAGMHEIIGYYRAQTAGYRPGRLSDEEINHNLWELEQARNGTGLQLFKGKLELAE